MKRLLFTTALLAALTCHALGLDLTVGDAYYVGQIVDGIPPSNEVEFINNLITLDADQNDTPIDTETYNREGSTVGNNLPPAIAAGMMKEEADDEGFDPTIDASGYTYVLGKYDAGKAGSFVWFLGSGFSGEVTLPETYSDPDSNAEYDLSHISLYNVPDGGATAVLLGMGILGLGWVRCRGGK